MKNSRYEFDPQADLELRLVEPNKQELLAPGVSASLTQEESRLTLQSLKFLPNRSIFGSASEYPRLFATGLITEAGSTLPASDVLSAIAHTSNSRENEIKMMMSSRHLKLASTYFRNMLDGPWKEACTSNQSNNSIIANEWDEQAFVIVMDIIHGHNRDVPKNINLELLCKIAVIVDYYGCHEAIEPFVELWLLVLDKEAPQVYGRRCILWICISWVFSRDQTFNSMTNLAIEYGQGLIDAPALPINYILGKYIYYSSITY
jgi:hypothetical protein